MPLSSAENGGPIGPAASLFPSFFGGGFECSTHHRAHDRRRLDLIAATGHDRHAAEDYRALALHGLGWARDGLRWHLIERQPGRYTWESFLPQLRAAQAAGTTVVWDLCHYGLPDGLDVWRPAFVDRFAAFARAAAQVVRDHSDAVPWWCPINEPSFWSWAGGDAAYFPPFANGRGFELKVQLARAAIAAAHAVRDVDPRARLLYADPLIHVACDPMRPLQRDEAEGHRLAQFQGWDLIAGHLWPQAGGSADLLDVVGVNYYAPNQWVHGGPPIPEGHPLRRPLRAMLTEAATRYGRPVVIAETGAEDVRRAPWLAHVVREARAARRAGADVQGLCLYPVTDYPGWDDERACPSGLFGHPDAGGIRAVHAPLARALRSHRVHFEPVPAEVDLTVA